MSAGYVVHGHTVWVSDEFLCEIMQSPDWWNRMGISLSQNHDHTNRECPDPDQIPWPFSPCFRETILRVPEGVYRITRYDAYRHAWTGSWPD